MTKLKHNQTLKTAFLLLAVFLCFTEPNAESSESYASFSPAKDSLMGFVSPSISNQLLSEISDIPASQDDTTGIVCPEDISIYTDLNSCDALVTSGLAILDPDNVLTSLTWQMEGATRDQSPGTGVNQLPSYLFNEGSTVVAYRGRTLYNDPVFCTFTVTVSDDQVPRLISSPGHITVRTLSEECYANVNWTEPSAIDNCVAQDQLIYSSNYNSGQQFPVGSTLVEYRISDGVNTAVHNFTVMVIDDEAPELIAPPDSESECGQSVPDAFTTWAQFERAGGSANDNCSVNYGSFRYVGQTSSGITCPYTVTRTYSISDNDGNVAEVKHVIEVTGEGMAYEATVESNEPEVLLEPGAETQAEILFSKTDVSCKGSRTGVVDLTVNGASGIVSFVWSTQNGSGIVQGAEDQTTLSDGDYTVMVYEDGVRLLTFDFSILVSDNQAPVLNAPATIQRKCGQSIPAAYSTWTEFANAGGTVHDNCQIYYSTFRLSSESKSNPDCPYTITRTYEITDVNGNRGVAEHLISVEAEEVVLKSGMGTAGLFVSTVTGGNWNDGSSWVGGVVPSSTDDVEIVSGATITLTDNRTCVDITNNGTLLLGNNNLQVDGNLTNNGVLTVGSGTITNYGNWTNNGTFTAGTGTVEFTGSTDATIRGSSATTFNDFVLNKGSDVSSSLEINSVGAVSLGNYTFTSGLLELTTGTYALSSAFSLPKAAGIHVNGATINTGDYTITNEGLIRITSGTANFGNSTGNAVHTQTDGAFEVSGGTVNIAGRLENSAGGTLVTGIPSGINISGGTINLATVGNGLSGTGALNVTQQGAFSFTAGTINIIHANSTSGTAVDLGIAEIAGNGTKTITNGVFHFGDGTNNTYNIISAINIPHITTSANTELVLTRIIDANGTYIFSLSDGSGNEIPVEIDITADSYAPGASITVSTTNNVFTNNESDINYLSRYWTVGLTGIANSDYTFTADYNSTDIVGTESEIKAGAWNGTTWTKGNLAGGNTITFNGLSGDLDITGITAEDPTVTASATNNTVCEGDPINLTASPTGDAPFTFAWTGPSGFTSTDQNPIRTNLSAADAGTYSVTVTDGNGFTTSDNVVVSVNIIPTVSVTPLTQQICPGGMFEITITNPNNVPGTSYTWTRDNTSTLTGINDSGSGSTIDGVINSSNPGSLETTTFTITASANGCSSQTTVDIVVGDIIAPTAVCQDITVQLDASGNATITAADIDNGSSDNCGIASLTLDKTTFDCTEVGGNTVTLTVTDVNGNSSTCTATVTLEDNVAPTAVCQDITVQLDASGNATITAADIDNGSSDNCGIASLTLDRTTFDCTEVGGNTVTLTVTDVNGNSSTCTATVTLEDNVAPTAICQDITVQLDASGNATITAADIDNGSSDNCGIASLTLDKTTFDCTEVGGNTVTLTVTDVNGNSSTCTATVTLEDNVAPTAVCQDITVQLDASGNATITAADIDNGSSDNCGIASLTLDKTTFDCTEVGGNTVTLTVTDVNGNSSTCTATVTLEDNVAPTAICQDITVQLDASGNATITAADIDNGSSDNCGIASLTLDKTTFDCTEVGGNTVTLTVTDVNGNSSTCTATVTLEDNVAPTAICQDITVQLDASGNATITAADIDNGSSDNCGIASLTLDKTTFDCTEVGGNTVTLTVTDVNGNSSTCTATVTLEDNVAPTAVCQDITVQLDASGNATITAADIDNGSSDNCGIASLTLDKTTFDCTEVGGNTVTLTVTDVNGNSSTCTATVTLEDNVAPTAICQDITVQLDASGNATITAADIDNGSSDNCGIASLTLDKTTFDCTEVGGNTVTLTVTDVNGNSSTCTATVTLEDNVAPTAICQDITVQLDASGNATITAADIDNGSSDNCGIASLTLDKTTFDCTEVGGNTVTLTVTDVNGNSSTCTATVTLEDNVAPTAICQDITVQLDASGNATITAADIDNGSSDNCGIASLTLDKTTFDCTEVGGNTVTLTVTDVNGNSSTCTATVTLEDNVAPTAICQDITVQLDASGNATITAADIDNGSSDNCGIASLTLDKTTFDCTEVGGNTVTLTVTDVNGNSSTCTATVTLEDNVAPTAVCQDITVQLDASGNATITAADIDNGSSDNCGIASLTLDKTTFDCTEVGGNTVTLTVTDVNGNSSTCTATVTLEDNIAPTAICQDITVQLDASGNATITAADIDNGSSDNCGIASLTLDKTTFDCTEVGGNTVTLTVTDVNGNSSTCTATVTLEDNVAPTAICQDITVQLDASGNATITAADIDNGSSDNCGIASLTLDKTTFDCTEVGGNTVTLTVTDVNGNSSTCTATVTLEDNVAPTAVCQDITVQLDASGNATITAADIDNGSSDNCGIASLTLDKTTFDCTEVGGNTVTLTVTDVNGNSSTCTATVTLEDNIAPTAICQDITVQLDASGNATITAADIDNGSSDNCGIASLTLDKTTFDCTEVGGNTVTLTVTDVNGNSSTCTATVTLEDNIAPTAVCQDITVQLDASGNATITAADIDNGSSDNCGIASLTLDKTTFDCTEVGGNTVTLTVTDVNGNSSTCTATVTLEDNIAPTAICQDITVQLDASGNATITAADIDNGSSDNCAITSRTLSQNNFDCDDVGENTVTLTITDVNGNSSTCDAKVTVEQTILPTALCKDIIVELDASGNATITAGDIDNGSSVVCGTPTLSIDQSTFDCNDVGTQTVILTVSDQNGNSSQCTATVTVQDNILPTVVCQDIIVALDASGAATIAAADIDNGSSDNCSIASLVLDQTSFDCSEVGDHTVTLTVTDEHGNSNSCTANVEIIDNINPIAICRDLTIQLNSSGTAVIAAADINDGSSDNCSIASVTINQTIFDCTHIGTNTVTLTVTDASGNSSTCDGTVTVEDNANPIAICKNYTVQLDATGNASITAADIDNGSNDACGIASLDLDRYDFTCADLGTNNVTLTVTDNNGNQSSCPAVVTVIDNLPPTASAGGSATICIDETHTLSGATANNGTIEWTHNGQGSLSDETTLTPSYTSVLADAGQTVTLTLTVTGSNACGTNIATATYTIDVNAVATVNPVDPMEYCAGETTTAVTLGSNLAGATFNISGGQDVGLFNQNGVSEIPSFTAIANTATISITPVYNGCAGDPIDVEITVKPRPSVSAAPLFQTICSGEATDIALGSNIPGATMSWTTTVEPAGSNITGMTAGVDESTLTISDVLVNNETTEVTVNYHIRAKADACEGPELNIVVKVKPALSASIAGTTTVCQEDPAPNITIEVTGGTAPYILTYNINGGSDIDVQLNSGTLINIPAPTDTDGDFVYTLVSVYESGGCTHMVNETATVTVSPKPYLSSTLTPSGVCSNNAFVYTPTSDTPGTTFSWSRAAVAGIDNPADTGTDDIYEFLINTTNAPIPVVYTYTLEAAGCTNTQDVVVMVTPTPSLTSTLSPDGVCSESPFSYTPTSDVSETTFPWIRAAVAGISNPAASGLGDILEVLVNINDNPIAVTYEYTLTSNDCVNPATYPVVVVVTPAPEVTVSADVSCVCPGGSVNLSSGSDIGGMPLDPILLNEDFENGASDWTTGSNITSSAWTIRNEDDYSDYFDSDDDSKYYLANSYQVNGNTRSRLTSPAINTVGYTSLTLDFYHNYDDDSKDDNADILVSTNGSDWTRVVRYNSDQGSRKGFSHATVDLTAYINESTLYIRFRYRAKRDRWWAIDNVTVTGTSTGGAVDVSWESIPAGFTSNEANPTNVTISEPTQFVATYVDPDTNCPGRDTVFVDICETPDPVIAPDYCAVAPNVLLTAYGGGAGATYDWRDSEGDQVGTDQQYIVSLVDRYQVTITNPNGCSATTQLEVSNEMVTNGDFEAGDTGFITDYLPSNNLATGGQGGSTGGEGLYAIGDDANDYHSNFWGDSDHTTGSGNYMIINGKGSQYVVWENAADITLLPGTNYYFSGWAMSLNSVGNDAQLVYEIEYDGIVEQIGSTAIIQPGVQNDNNTWLSSGRFYGNWTYTGTSITTARIRVVNLRPDDPGNDFGIDDLSFGTFDPFPLVIDVDFDEVCEGDTLFLYSNSQYGKEPIIYSWTGPNGFTSTEQNPIIPNFSIADAGKYKLEAQDAYGCDILPDSTVVPFNEAPIANAGPDDFVCTANPVVNLNGSIGGSATSGYWTGSGGSFVPDANALNATYTISQTEIDAGIAELILSTNDPTGVCEADKDTVYITIYNSLEITTSSTMPDCHGGANGTATATVSVTTVEPYTYLWSDGQTTPIARNLAAGTYTVTVTDANGCTAQATVTVDEPDLFVISAISPIISAPSCYGATDGSATMEVTGGTPPYSFIWDAATGDQRTATASNLAAGTYTVLVTDANGCSAATFTATIPNPPPPSLQCPDDVEDIIDDAACTIVLDDIEEPVFDGYCTTTLSYELSGATTGSGTGSVNGQVNFNVGITTVTYRIEDTAGNQDECSFTVWVKHQNLLPTRYDCPDPIVNAGTPDNYECLKNVTLGQVTLDDQCNEIESIWHDSPYSSDPANASGDYPVGSTSFQWFIRDVSGNIETCDVTVIVDDLDPVITCPVDVIETIAANECSKTGVTIDPPDYDDNCPNPVLSYVLTGATTGSGTGEVPSYQVFNIGVTTVTYTVTDAHNNTAQCSFNVTIERLSIPPAVITCPPNPAKVTAVGGTCFAPVSPAAPTVVDPCATTTYTIVNDFNNSDDASDSYPVGTTIVTWTISDNSGKTYECTQTVVVEDLDPTITCPTSVAETIAADQCSKTGVTIDPPTFSDNCPNPVLAYTLSGATTGSGINVVPASQVFNIGVTTVTYTVTDTDNRTAECSFTVTIERLSIPPAVITCPVDPPSVTAVAGTCFAPVNPDAPVISDPCATASYTIVNDFTGTDDASGSYPVGTTTVTWTITDNSGKIYTCEQEVVVEDLDPVISCPSDVSEIIAADACSKSDVVLGTPTYSDNCPNPVLTYELSGATTGSGSGTVPANQVFNIGETTVTYTVTDTDNRSASCSYTVTIVRFSIPPAAINCPPDPTPLTAVAGTCFAPVSPAPPTINDPCATTTYTIVNDFTGTDDASDSYPVGTTTVIWTITDNSGKIYTCNQEVIVEDIPPSINCPADYTFLADENVNYKDNVTLADPTYEDNCPNPILEWTRVEPDGTTTHSASTGINFIANPGRYYIGVTTITYKITDSSGLTDECSFTVTVTGIPEIDCPDDILQPTDAGVCTRALDPGVPVLKPGSPTVDSWTWEMTGATTGSGSNAGNTPNPISPNPYTFNVGVTTITWTACNISGCATCEQIIIITDEEPPVITADPYENCVDPLHWAVYNENNPTPQFGHVDPNLEKSPIDYRTLLAGDTDLDLTSLTDNCCDSLSMINNLQWRIEFADTPDPITGAAVSHPNITGEGQPSEYTDPDTGLPTDILLWGDGVTFNEEVHHIFYWAEDCNGNVSDEIMREITITPRPEVRKTDY
ncbi:HYR domain-containing protein [uncultured Draconibacterium sp.]|uniref:HYR domain-containing protein n=1 Tax=uncultured Draconibacterium sp. TaxID=1573823 RepID=UPI0029C6FA2C|nr:HYR domain-containing protein [uncultured Draconibacterium sp.]